MTFSLALRLRLGCALCGLMLGINYGRGHLFVLGKQVPQACLVGRERRGPVELVHGLVQSLMHLRSLGGMASGSYICASVMSGSLDCASARAARMRSACGSSFANAALPPGGTGKAL